jgi:hypothetical protein
VKEGVRVTNGGETQEGPRRPHGVQNLEGEVKGERFFVIDGNNRERIKSLKLLHRPKGRE